MSDKFTGVTFAKQKVTPSDDGTVRRTMLTDGILSGCELSYSGSTLTMAAGHLMACGRQFRHPASQNWAVVDATSGFARLVATIDLTKTATKETFDQIDASIEYASAVDGFVDLEQADLNGSGSMYQVVLCVVSLGTGGITGIVSAIGRSCNRLGVLLWENASPDSDFAAQSIELDLADYSHILVDFVTTEASLLIRKGSYTAANRINVTSTDSNAVVIEMMRRLISFSDTAVAVHTGYRSMYTLNRNQFTDTVESSAFAKPFRIYGVKGVL